MNRRRFLLHIAVILALSALLTGCASEPAEIQRHGKAYYNFFDTVSYVYSYAGDSAEQFEDRSAEASRILEEYHKLFDIYHEYSGVNNLCTVNRLAGGECVQVDERLIDFLLYAKQLYDETDGEMNVMMGAVLSIWHNCRSQASEDPSAARLPSSEELEHAAAHTDIALLEIDKENCTVRISDPEASIDVGAVGKGYATEMAAKYLESIHADGYVLNVGGNLRIIGAKPDGSGWVTGIRDPDDSSADFAAQLYLSDTSCVTSGVYERYYTVKGTRYHHIIDRDTLFPADYFLSLTVLTQDSGLADALSTALFCMSYEDGLALIERFGNVDVLWIFPDGEIRYTPGLEDRIIN